MMRKTALFVFATLAALSHAAPAAAFCGFYVAKADTTIFNKASQVVLVRDGDRTVLTMSNDFRGDPREFAMVIPVPTSITREQIHVADAALVSHLDAYTAPRLVEYFDADPCARYDRMMAMEAPMSAVAPAFGAGSERRARNLGVTSPNVESSSTAMRIEPTDRIIVASMCRRLCVNRPSGALNPSSNVAPAMIPRGTQ